MIIKKIKLENIRSYKNQEIEFPEGSILLSGDIGSGKTSVLLGIEFALFGLQPSQRGASLLKNGEKQGRVILEFEIDEKAIIIERTLKRSKKSVSQDYSAITINDEKMEASVTEIKNKVLNLLDYPLEFSKKTNLLYKFTVYTPQEEMKNIITESADTRLNTLRHVFGIDKYKRIEENIDIFKKRLREEIRNKEGQISDIDKIKENLEQKKQRLISIKEKKQQENKSLQEKKLYREQQERQLKELEEKVKEKDNLKKEKERNEFIIQNKKEAFNELNSRVEQLKKEIQEGRKISLDKEKLENIQNNIIRNKEKVNSLQEKIIEITGKLNSFDKTKKESSQLKLKISNLEKCPTCLQEVGEQYKKNIFEKIEREINSIQEQESKLIQEKKDINSSLEQIREETESFEKQKSELEILKVKLQGIQEKEKSLSDLQEKARKTNYEINQMLEKVKELDNKISEFSRFSSLYEEKTKDLEKARTNEKQQEIKVAELNKEISLISDSITEIETQINKKQQIKKRVEYLKELENWLTEKFLNLVLFTEKNVMLKLKEEFSNLFTEWVSVLVPETLSARLDEQFTPIVEQQGYDQEYDYLSGGERTAIALAYRLSLNQVINSLLSKIKTRDLVILDEPTDGFSEQQLDKMRDVLSQLNAKQLILVSHEAKIESFVDNIIKFKKQGGTTVVE
jgi:exonuclease SbcC